MNTSSTQRPGEHFGSYELIKPIGYGGFAEVWLARGTFSKWDVAIKVLHVRLADPTARRRFREEASKMHDLEHPNVLKILEYSIQDEVPYLVLKYAPNGTTRAKPPQSYKEIVEYTKQTASGLSYLHRKGLIHCDIKPENLLIGPDSSIWIGDFGIAYVVTGTQQGIPSSIMGTFVYMAPEQFDGNITPACDQYALAATVYEWLCGSPLPFTGQPLEIARQKRKQVSTLRDKNAAISVEAERLVQKALSAEPAKRFSDIEEFAHELEKALLLGTTQRQGPSAQQPAPPSSPGSLPPAQQHPGPLRLGNPSPRPRSFYEKDETIQNPPPAQPVNTPAPGPITQGISVSSPRARHPRLDHIFDEKFLKKPKNHLFFFGGLLPDLLTTIALLIRLHDGNAALLILCTLIVVRSVCSSTVRKDIAIVCSLVLAFGWGVGCQAFLDLFHWNLWMLSVIIMIMGIYFQAIQYALKKPR